ncbi:hypothetical protein [Klebsiella pneumoniae]|uniref:Y-family DNA polymerase n=1 Tax=Klebsiella pneumoniae TaxID=573 RepID=UPI00338EE4C1
MVRPIALIDGNNFYVSCERVFQPHLLGKPVIILSNNDGCAVARSEDYVELKIKLLLPLDNGFYKISNMRVGIFWHVD